MPKQSEDQLADALQKNLDSVTLDTSQVAAKVSLFPAALQTLFFDLVVNYVSHMANQYNEGLFDHMPELLRIGARCKDMMK